MAKPTSQWACIAILALMISTFTAAHAVRLPHIFARSRELLMEKHGEPETNNVQASESGGEAAQHMGNIEASSSGCSGNKGGKGIYGGGQGSGGTSIKFPNIFRFPWLPFAGLVPEVTTWGEGGGFGGANDNPGTGVTCQCSHNRFPMNYVITPVYFQPMDTSSLKNIKDGPVVDVTSGPSGN
ncbi:hypothetical protein QVD17_20044 [Tagetes erecta]|uniref:Uncharacterized protein n=1 Tax=Tagetes erecta TaxID=13708 RepID=A0AAD8KKJ8_TARER|nr:hypothetical protein QVD17_20044 [Tagetes erecta]